MHERWLILAVLTFARTAIGFQFQSVAVLSPFLLEEFALSYAGLGTLVGIYLLPGVIISLPSGVLAQRFGDKKIACIGLAAMTAGGLLMAHADDATSLLIGRLVSGTGAVLFNVLVAKMVTDWFQGKELVTALGILIASWPLGIAIALLVLPAMAGAFSWSASMFMAAMVSGAAVVLVAFYYRKPHSLANQSGPFHIDLTRREFSLATIAGLVWTSYNVAFVVLLAFGPPYLVASGWGTEAANAIISIVSWVIIPALPLTACIAERIGRPNATMITCFGAAAFAIWCVPSSNVSVGLFVLIGALLAPPGGLVMALPCETVRPQRRAIAMGVYFTCFYGGMGVLLPVAGFARDLTGSAATPLWFAGASLLIAIAMLLFFRAIQSHASSPSPAAALPDMQSLPAGRIRY
jgi:MFS family permease